MEKIRVSLCLVVLSFGQAQSQTQSLEKLAEHASVIQLPLRQPAMLEK
jgi:hypothetical protein